MAGAAVVFSIFLIFAGAALLATAALYARQPLLVAYIGLARKIVAPTYPTCLIQLTVLLTFIASSYWVGMRYPTPIANSARLRRA